MIGSDPRADCRVGRRLVCRRGRIHVHAADDVVDAPAHDGVGESATSGKVVRMRREVLRIALDRVVVCRPITAGEPRSASDVVDAVVPHAVVARAVGNGEGSELTPTGVEPAGNREVGGHESDQVVPHDRVASHRCLRPNGCPSAALVEALRLVRVQPELTSTVLTASAFGFGEEQPADTAIPCRRMHEHPRHPRTVLGEVDVDVVPAHGHGPNRRASDERDQGEWNTEPGGTALERVAPFAFGSRHLLVAPLLPVPMADEIDEFEMVGQRFDLDLVGRRAVISHGGSLANGDHVVPIPPPIGHTKKPTTSTTRWRPTTRPPAYQTYRLARPRRR